LTLENRLKAWPDFFLRTTGECPEDYIADRNLIATQDLSATQKPDASDLAGIE